MGLSRLDGRQLRTSSASVINPNWDLTPEFAVVVGQTLVVLPCGSHIGDLVPVLAVSVARSDLQLPIRMTTVLPDYLEDIVKGSHTSLGDTGRQSLHELLHRYEHVFPAPGEPVTGRSKLVQHEIDTNEGRPVFIKI